jgi:hypothetical protein
MSNKTFWQPFGLTVIVLLLAGCDVVQADPPASVTPIPPAAQSKSITETATPQVPSISEALGRHTVRVKGGSSAADIRSFYGEPSSAELPMHYDPPVMYFMEYKSLGLDFALNQDRLWGIGVKEPFSGEVFGLRIGDPISRAIAIYGNDFKMSVQETGPARYSFTIYSWKDKLPNWVFYVRAEKIYEFDFRDDDIYGYWIPKLR